MKFPCQVEPHDTLFVDYVTEGIYIEACMGAENAQVILSPEDARKLAAYLVELAEIHNG